MNLPSLKAPAPSVPGTKPRPEKLQEVLDQDEIDLRNALTAIVEIFDISAEDLIRERRRINLPKWQIDAKIWKANG